MTVLTLIGTVLLLLLITCSIGTVLGLVVIGWLTLVTWLYEHICAWYHHWRYGDV